MGRNTALLKEIVTVLDSELDDALDTLESHFHDALLVRTLATSSPSPHLPSSYG